MNLAPPPDSALAPIETQAAAGLATKAYRAAIRGKGQEASQAGSREAMDFLLRQAVEAAPGRAMCRETLIDDAWSGLPGWRS